MTLRCSFLPPLCSLFLCGMLSQPSLAETSSASSPSQDRFAAANEAMAGGDWESAVKIQESLVGDGIVTAPLLTNLAIARLKQNNLPQSLAAWLAARSVAPDAGVIQEGLVSTLTAEHLGIDVLDLSAHGPLTAWLAERSIADVQKCIYAAMISLLCSAILIASSLLSAGKSKFKVLLIPTIVVTVILWGATIWIYLRVGAWGAVTDQQGAVLRSSPHETATELTRIKTGTPIFVTGDTYSRWLDVRTADGYHGYVDGLQVRVIRTR